MSVRLVYLFFGLVGIFIGYGLFLVSGSDVRGFDARLVVGNVPGINNDIEYFDFGEVPVSGGMVNKFMDIQGGNFSQRIHIEVSGDISDFISVSENDFVIGVGEMKRVTVRAVVLDGIESGEYDGRINFYYSEI